MSSYQASSNVPEYSVGELAFSLKKTVENAYGRVKVRGEISGFRGRHSSGHSYFRLKDDKATLESVIWKGVYQKLKFKPEEGLEIIATGKITTFPGSSKYQIMIDHIEPAGAGALMALLEARKKKLAAEGLFDQDHKKELPFLPRSIGVITSPTGAVIKDILHRLSDRFARPVLLWPVRVQGETSADEICAAIKGFNTLQVDGTIKRPDVLIIARGGGSLEDLWSFNEENVVRAASQSAIPILSAIGHETDWTLLDLVSDKRAPTPTGAAEMSVPVRQDLVLHIQAQGTRLRQALLRYQGQQKQMLDSLMRAMPALHEIIALPRQRLDHQAQRFLSSFLQQIHRKQNNFDHHKIRLNLRLIQRSCDAHRSTLHHHSNQLSQAPLRHLQLKRKEFEMISRRFQPHLLVQPLSYYRSALFPLSKRLQRSFIEQNKRHRQRLAYQGQLLNSYSYRKTLERGFTLIRDKEGRAIRSYQDAEKLRMFTVEFADGALQACPAHNKHIAKKTAPTTPLKKGTALQPLKASVKQKKSKTEPSQNDLFS